MKGIQILTEKNKKEVKEHGSYTFPVQVSPEAIQSYESGDRTYMVRIRTDGICRQ